MPRSPAPAPASPRSRAIASRRAIPGWSTSTSPTTASAPRSSGWTAPSRRRSPSASPTSSPTSSRPARRCAAGAGDLRRADPAQRGGPHPPGGLATRPRAVEVLRRRLHGVVTARHYVMIDYDVPADARRGSLRDHPRAGVADRLAPAEQGLGRGPGDGAAGADQPDHGRALRPRRPGHPRHRHRRLPAVTAVTPSGRAPGAERREAAFAVSARGAAGRSPTASRSRRWWSSA